MTAPLKRKVRVLVVDDSVVNRRAITTRLQATGEVEVVARAADGAEALKLTYELKPDAPDNAVDTISQNVVVPVLEKMLADGTIIEYEIDVLSVHTQAPGTFSIV